MPGIDAQAELRGWIRDELGAACLGEEYRYEVATRIVLAAKPGEVNAVLYRVAIWRANPLLGGAPLIVGYDYTAPPSAAAIAALVADALPKLRALAAQLLSVTNGAGA